MGEGYSKHKPTMRVLAVLQALSKSQTGLTLMQLSRKLNIPAGTLFPIMRTMVHEQFVFYQASSSSYVVGVNAFMIGSAYSRNNQIMTALRREMKNLSRTTQETSHLAVLLGGDVSYIAKIDSPRPVRLASSVGYRVPAYCTALGKALLSGLSDEEIQALYPHGLARRTEKTIKSPDELIETIRSSELNGIFRDEEESAKGLFCLAIALHAGDKVIAAASVTTPSFRMSKELDAGISSALLAFQKRAEELIVAYSDKGSELLQ